MEKLANRNNTFEYYWDISVQILFQAEQVFPIADSKNKSNKDALQNSSFLLSGEDPGPTFGVGTFGYW